MRISARWIVTGLFWISTCVWAQVYTGSDGGSYDATQNFGEFISMWIAGTPTATSYNAQFTRNLQSPGINISITGATPVNPSSEGGVYNSGVALVPNFTVYTGSQTTSYSLVWKYSGLDLKAQLSFDLKYAQPLSYTGNTISAACQYQIPFNQGETWSATYNTNYNNQPGTKQITWQGLGLTTFNGQSGYGVQTTEADSSGTKSFTNYYAYMPTGLLHLGMTMPATSTAPATQKVFSPPPTSQPFNLQTSYSSFYFTIETVTSGSSVSTTPKISSLTFAGIKSVTTPAGPFNACQFRYLGAVNGQPMSIVDSYYDSATGGLVRRDVDGSTVQLVTQYKF
jgi:hypothetical protein